MIPYPWLGEKLRLLATEHVSGRFPHGLMVTGLRGTGKLVFAEEISRLVLCDSPDSDGLPCGQCSACQAVTDEGHPDFSVITLEYDDKGKQKKVIGVDQIRTLISTLGLRSHAGGYKVALIHPAEALSDSAANALLKTLEEPPGETLLILVTDRPGRLPATVRSRCRTIEIGAPSIEALAWMEAEGIESGRAQLLLGRARGAPLAARALDREDDEDRKAFFKLVNQVSSGQANATSLINSMPDNWVEPGTRWLNEWITDMIRLANDPESETLVHSDLRPELARMASKIPLQTLFRLADALKEAQRLLETPVNAKMQLEGHLIRLSAVSRL